MYKRYVSEADQMELVYVPILSFTAMPKVKGMEFTIQKKIHFSQ